MKNVPSPSPGRRPAFFWVAAAVLAAAVLWAWRAGHRRSLPQTPAHSPASPAPFESAGDRETFAAYAGSESCRDCHAAAYQLWTNSHHALAERKVDPLLDLPAFAAHTFAHGTQVSAARAANGHFQLTTMGADGRPAAFEPDRAVGESPLRQFLFPFPGGRWQAGELAFDPATGEWFDVFGAEDRIAGEWGHWTGRGMTWNSMCASCHNTRLRKNYQIATDSYATAMAERGVGCEACHGPLQPHVAWQRGRGGAAKSDPTAPRLGKDRMLDVCGSCHARRGELTGDFTPGEKFLDHFSLTIPDASDLYYPDGQVRGENYEFTSFLSSKMHAAGVRCTDCHEPHSGRNLIPGDALCLKCHAAPAAPFPAPAAPSPAPAPKIDPLTHSHHRPGTLGGRCVDCHMPQTTYMRRHPRRDHGFTIPDPLLTKRHDIPNACNRCHADRDADWALEAVDRWYGPRMDRPTRARARQLADARSGRAGSSADLLGLLATEKTPLWRAAAARLLQPWNADPAVARALAAAAADPDPLVRAGVAHALDGFAQPGHPAALATLRGLSADPIRAVRVEAAWASRARLDPGSVAARDLLLALRQNLDQPSGLHQMGLWHFDRNEHAAALDCFRRAIEWDANSPPLRHSYAIALSTQGQAAEAAAQLEAACRLAPTQSAYRYQLGLALNEMGRLAEATAALEEAVRLDPRLGPAWYNLGLAYAAAQDLDRSVEALSRAETCQPDSARAPYALATVLARLGRVPEARAAALRALALQPDFAEASELLAALARGPAE